MPIKKRFSASEIAAMHLPGLPTTKGKVIARAASEGWPFEEQKGVGGTRRLYEIPAKYLPKDQVDEEECQAAVPVVSAIVAGTAKVDPKKLELAMRALAEWEQERGIKIDEDRRPAVVSVLYDYLQRGSEEEIALVLRALAG